MSPVRRAVFALVLVLVGSATARAAELELPSAPLRRYYQEERRRGAERSEALARALLASAEHAPPAARLERLEQAALADPTLPEPHLRRASLLLRRRDLAGACVALRDAGACVAADAVQQALWLRRLEKLGHTLPLVTLATLVVFFAARVATFAHHVLLARPRTLGVALLAAAAALPVAYAIAPVLGVLVALAFLAPFLARRERRVLAGLLVALAVAEIALPRLQGFALLLDPRSASALLARAHHAGWDPALQAEILDRVPSGSERELVLGLLARRKGDLAASRSHYAASLQADSTRSTVYVDLANLYFLSGEPARAAAGYRAAQALAPNNPFACGNLAQTYILMLHFDESDAELSRAAKLGFDRYRERQRAWLRDKIPVLDQGLSAHELLRYAYREAKVNPAQALAGLAPWRGAAWGHLSLHHAPWVLLLLAAFLFTQLRVRDWAFECTSCARVVCTHCTRPRDSGARLCPYCGVTSAQSIPNELLPSRRERPRGRPQLQPPRVANRAPSWTAALFPGAADLVRGAPRLAAWTALVGWSALLVAAAHVHAAAYRASPWFAAVDAQALRGATLVFWLAYVPGLVRLRRTRRPLTPSQGT